MRAMTPDRLAKLWLAAFSLSLAVLQMSAFSASAHEQKVAITQVLFNPNSGNIEIAHRLNLHDAEHAVQDQWGKSELASNRDDIDKLALYTRGNFFMWINGQSVDILPVGVEVDDIYVWVYDELPIPGDVVRTISIDNSILRDVWDDQANLVNVEIGRFRKSAFFSGADRQKTIEVVLPEKDDE